MAKLLGDAVDEVRRAEVQETLVLKQTRYLWLKNPDKLSDKQRRHLESLSRPESGEG